MIRALLALAPNQKRHLRTVYYKLRHGLITAFRSYGVEALRDALSTVGLGSGDSVIVHAGFTRFSGFKGSPSDFIDALVDAVSPDGHVVMVSMAYMSSAYEYLSQGKIFDVRKTVSHMGVISEAFRRRAGVIRSMHPSNPLLVTGPRAAWIVERHEECQKPCGRGSPFDKLAQLRAKILFYDASIFGMTFFHYLEDMVEDRLSFPLFRQGLIEAKLRDYDGNIRTIRTYTYSDEAIRRRYADVMLDDLDAKGRIKRTRVGNSQLTMLETADLIDWVTTAAANQTFFYK